jgi:hypothetical protein
MSRRQLEGSNRTAERSLFSTDAGDGPVRDVRVGQRVPHRHRQVPSTPQHDQTHLQCSGNNRIKLFDP